MSATHDAELTEAAFPTKPGGAIIATDEATALHSGAAACPNCGDLRVGSYCSTCGQKAAPLAPTLGYFLHELTHELLNVDGKIFRSVRLLLTQPGFLTREFFA